MPYETPSTRRTRRRRRIAALGRKKPFVPAGMSVLTAKGSGTGIFPLTDPEISPLKFGGGPTLARPTIKPIFWGKEWSTANPPIHPATILSSIQTIIDGPYLDGLRQYGFTGKPALLDALFVTKSDPAPTTANWDVEAMDFLKGLIDDEKLPEPDEDWSRLNFIFMPSTVTYEAGSELGFHATFQWVDYDLFDLDDDPVRFAVSHRDRAL
jgi:hypothetical protein